MVRDLKKQYTAVTVMRSIPVVGDESIATAKSYDGGCAFLLSCFMRGRKLWFRSQITKIPCFQRARVSNGCLNLNQPFDKTELCGDAGDRVAAAQRQGTLQF